MELKTLSARFKAIWSQAGARRKHKRIEEAWHEWARFHDTAIVGRSYHNAVHIADCLEQFDSACELFADPIAGELTLWYHDFICVAGKSDNERMSAHYFAAAGVSLGIDMALLKRVSDSIVEATTHDGRTRMGDDCLIADIDMSILGRAPKAFDRYDHAIRLEYRSVPIDAYRQGRAKVLQSFLDQKRIYSTKHFRELYEKQARRNLSRVIDELNRGIRPSE